MKGKSSMVARTGLILVLAGLAGVAGMAVAVDSPRLSPQDVARGKYLVEIAGCNDCHTPMYGMSGGQTPESEWLVGDSMGWEGPWGTTYASNLRRYFSGLTETQWLEAARNLSARPPMPWFNVRRMSDDDLRAIYRYVKSLPVKGDPVPAYLPPGQQASGPVFAFRAPARTLAP